MGYRMSKFIARNRTGVAAATFIAIAVLAGTAASLYEARRARQNELRAERRFNDVRALADSLLFDIHDAIRDLPGSTPARKLIVERAQEYLDNLSRESQSDPKLLVELANAYIKLATVQGDGRDANLGNTPALLANFRKAVDLLEGSAALDPANTDTRELLARTRLNYGRALNRTGNKKENEEQIEKSLAILEPLASSSMNDRKAQAALGDAYAQAGFAQAEKNNLAQALDFHTKALAMYSNLAEAEPSNDVYRRDLSFCHKRVAAILGTQKQYSEALDHERAALTIDEALLAAHPDSVQAQYNITFTYSDTGYFLNEQKDYDSALAWYRKAQVIRQALVDADPRNTRAKEGLSNTENYIGLLLRNKGEFRPAIDSLKKGLAIRKELLEKDPTNDDLRTKVAESEWGLGDLYAALAFHAKTPRSSGMGYCRELEIWDRNALTLMRQQTDAGHWDTFKPDDLKKVTEDLARCDQLLGTAAQR